MVNHYRYHPKFAGQPEILTFFSGDAFNPSLESCVTKGRHMVPFLNKAGTNIACMGVGLRFLRRGLLLIGRITISISVSPNSVTSAANANSPGCWRMSWIPRSASTFP